MVRLALTLLRTPVIKFPKGELGRASVAGGSTAVPVSAAQPTAQGAQVQSSAAMSSCPISDMDLPAKYRRAPLSQEEIDKINGGGIV